MSSFDPDHALAIILQARFNEEAKQKSGKDKENFPVRVKAPAPQASLVDPEWETTDPCPDVHGLFVAFNERFFWGRLLGVEVKWSPQMTSCAGICVYEGRNGLCSVRLSTPLLKLRPRSDLVETLLHEMIHAYLFVTNNNRDRDGHGPEFHKHMDRINREAGTNITVYHSFHAEVKLYQQHWWRCSGPCQRRSPFFGMVKRARNRAPGPNDFWWAEHRQACGGQFIKVREPEDYNKKKNKGSKDDKAKANKDIKDFFKKPTAVKTPTSAPANHNKVGVNIFGFSSTLPKSSSTSDSKSSMGGNPLNRVVGFKDLSSAEGSSITRGKPASPFGGGRVLGGGREGPKVNGVPTGSTPGSGVRRGTGRGGMLGNRGTGTLVVTGSQGRTKPAEKPPSPNTKLRIDTFKVFSGSGFTLGGPSGSADRSRSRLLSIGQEPEHKKQKTMEENVQKSRKSGGAEFSNGLNKNDDFCKCLVCNERVPREEMDIHLEGCAGLRNVFNNSTVIEKEICADEKEISDINKKYKVTSCPVCSLHIEGDINSHLDECLNNSGILNILDESVLEIDDSSSSAQNSCDKSLPRPMNSSGILNILDESVLEFDDSSSSAQNSCDKSLPKPINLDDDVEIIEPEARVACPLCGMRFGESRINDHVNQCLDSEDEFQM